MKARTNCVISILFITSLLAPTTVSAQQPITPIYSWPDRTIWGETQNNPTMSVALIDLNNDGLLDIVGGHGSYQDGRVGRVSRVGRVE